MLQHTMRAIKLKKSDLKNRTATDLLARTISSRGLSSDTSSDAWKVSLSIAKGIKDDSTDDNPIGTCLWFNTNTYYNSVTKKNGGKYSFGGSKTYKVVEKVVIENHTFFRVEGYNL